MIYTKFKNINHVKKNIGNNSDHDLSLDRILENKNDIFLKIDIDNDEYYLLDQIIKNQHKITSLIIEFHMVPLFLEKIEKFLLNTQLRIIHIHANNNGGFDNNKLPLIIELTLCNERILDIDNHISVDLKFPHELDKPCNKYDKEFKIIFN